MATAGGNNCAAGAASGMAGEEFAGLLGRNTNFTKSQIIESSKLIGALTAASILGADDGDSVFAGSQIARNAAENNYQKDVHKYLTKYLAENAGFTPEEARQIAAGDYRVDTRLGKEPILSESAREKYHFTSPKRLEEMRDLAYQTGDKRLFGEYLHALQDSFSHQRDGVPYDSAFGHAKLDSENWISTVRLDEIKTSDLLKTLPGGEVFVGAFFGESNASITLPVSGSLANAASGDFGAYEDWTFVRPDLADKMAETTYDEMRSFLQNNYGQTRQLTNGNWNRIFDNVQKFNRAPVLNDPEKKGKILYD